MAALRRARKRKVIASNVKKARLRKGVSQAWCSRELGITRAQWCLIESGERSIPAERLREFSRLLQTRVDDLLGA